MALVRGARRRRAVERRVGREGIASASFFFRLAD